MKEKAKKFLFWEKFPHLFNGKERDEESGLYYYGARYYDERTSLFANPDPLWTGYADVSPTAFCHGNPTNRIDPTGLFDTEDEAFNFGMYNNVMGRITERADGTFEIYDEDSRTTYYRDEDGLIHTQLPQTEANASIQDRTVSAFERFSNAYVALAERADSWTNDVMFPVVAGLAQLLPPIGLTNDVMTLKGEDMFGNETSEFDKSIASIDLFTFGAGKFKLFSKIGKKSVKFFREAKITEKNVTILDNLPNDVTTATGCYFIWKNEYKKTHQK